MARRVSVVIETITPPDLGHVVMKLGIPSTSAAKGAAIERIIETLRGAGLLSAEKEMEWRLCLDEALVNAIVHGNQRDPRRLIIVSLMISDRAWGVRIEDEGRGFSPASVPDPDAEESLLLEHGRGILLMKSLLDEVRYYAGGSKVLLVKRLARKGARRPAKKVPRAKTAARGRRRRRPADSKAGL